MKKQMIKQKIIYTIFGLLFSGCLMAAEQKQTNQTMPLDSYATTFNSKVKTKYKQDPTYDFKRTQSVYSLLINEFAWKKGYKPEALILYMDLLSKNPRPEIAERGMQMALDLHAFQISHAFLEEWRKIEPTPSFSQKRMAFEEMVALGKVDEATDSFVELINDADEKQRGKMFLLMGDLALHQPLKVKEHVAKIHDLSLKYKDLPEAALIDTLYSAIAENKKHAINALKRLSSLEENPDYATQITLFLLSKYYPSLLDEFFRKSDVKKLPYMWQRLYVDSLLRQGKTDEAYQQILSELEKAPDANLYIQAGYFSILNKDPLDTALNFFEKAYSQGNPNEKSKAAVFATVAAISNKNIEKAKLWLEKINDGFYDFDKQIILATFALDEKRFKDVKEHLDKIYEIKSKQRLFFNDQHANLLHLDYIVFGMPKEDGIKEISRLMESLSKQTPTPSNAKLMVELLSARASIYAEFLDQPEKAVADLEVALRISPDNPNLYNSLGYTMLSIPNKINEGMELIQKAYQAMPDNAPTRDSLGWGYYLQGYHQQALAHLRFAYEHIDKDGLAEVASHLAEVLIESNQKEEAIEILKKAYEADKNDKTLQRTLKKYKIKLP